METGKTMKQALRARLRAQAKTFEADYLTRSDAAIEALLFALPEWAAAQSVFLYLSMGTEPETRGIFKRAIAGGKRVGVPRCLGSGVMESRAVATLEGLTPGAFGILEPEETAPLLEAAAFDLVVAPCVAVDRNGFRLGNGGGYYDRFLPQARCPVVCLCRGRLLQPEVPREPFDVPVDIVLTEDGVIRPQGGRAARIP